MAYLSAENQRLAQRIGMGFLVVLLLAALAIGIAALVMVLQDRNDPSNEMAFMSRTVTSTGGQPITGGTPHTVLFDTLLNTACGFHYGLTGGEFTPERSGYYQISANLAIDTDNTGLGPVTAWITKSGSNTLYGIDNSTPLSTSIVSGNSHYIALNTFLYIESTQSVQMKVLSASDQRISSGPASYIAIGVPSVRS